MAIPRVIRQSLWSRFTIRLFCASFAAQVVAVMMAVPRYPPPHPGVVWPLLGSTLALMILMPLRLSRLFVRMSRDVLEVRNSLSTRRLQRTDIASIRTAPVPLRGSGLQSPRRVAYAVLRTGGEVRLEALGSAVPGRGRFEAHVAEIERWLHPLDDHPRRVEADQHAPPRSTDVTLVVLGGLATAAWLGTLAFQDVAVLRGSIAMMRIAVLLFLALCVAIFGGAMIVMHHRGELPRHPTPEEDECEAARFYAERQRDVE